LDFAERATPDLTSEYDVFSPVRILEVELSRPLPNIDSFNEETGRHYPRALALVRLHQQPLGVVELPLGKSGISAPEYASFIWQTLGVQINEYLGQMGLPEVPELSPEGIPLASARDGGTNPETFSGNTPAVSVVVATRDRTESLEKCLQSLLSLDYPAYEIVVVDNAPSSTTTADFIRDKYGDSSRVRYLYEGLPGLGAAHNRGLGQVKNPLVAFTDDDVVVDKCWLKELVHGFSVAENVACVTGMIFPIELETQSQVWTEQYWGLCKGFTRRIFDLDQNRLTTPLYPYTAGVFGSGANMAFRTSVLRDLGGFDIALGAGTLARGGDDLASFLQVISHGYAIVYQPAAIVHHQHRRDYEGLRRQAFGYGVGLTAYLAKSVIDRPGLLLTLMFRLPYGLSYILSSRPGMPGDFPRELKHLERKGMLYGPLAYLRSRWQRRNVKPSLEPAEELVGPQGLSYE
jgi:GT2 family glycosyltransferase